MAAPCTLDLPGDLLYSEVSDEDVAVIARDHLTRWEELSPFLELSEAADEEIRRTRGGYGEEKKALLRQWRRTHGRGATYRVLIEAAERANNMLFVGSLEDMLRNRSGTSFAKGVA